MYLRLAFSIAIHSSADIFLFDEVLAVGDESFQVKCLQKIKDIRSENGTIIVVSHDKIAINSICDHIITLEHGVVASGI
jgi:ABC-type polysaccharide/polyol phosphate transport system ATPase subunit